MLSHDTVTRTLPSPPAASENSELVMANDPAPLRLRRDQLTWRSIDTRVVVLDLKSSEYLEINEAGSLLFEALGAGAQMHELAALLRNAYDISEVRAASDAAAFVDKLRAADLLEAPEAEALAATRPD